MTEVCYRSVVSKNLKVDEHSLIFKSKQILLTDVVKQLSAFVTSKNICIPVTMENEYAYYVDEENDLSGELLPCEFCGELFPAGIFIDHSSACQFEMEKKESEEAETKSSKLDGLDGVLSNLVDITRKSISKQDMAEAEQQNRKTFSSVKLNVDGSSNNLLRERKKFSSEDDLFEDAVDYDSSSTKPSMSFSGTSRNYFATTKLSSSTAVEADKEKDDELDGKEYVLSDDEDDAVESIESFWKRAQIVLKKRKNINDTKCNNTSQNKYDYSNKSNNTAANNTRSKFNNIDWTW